MQIKDLPSTSTVNSTDVLAKETSGGTTNKIAVSDFVINNLTSTSTTKPLSAAQGKALNDMVIVQSYVSGVDPDNYTTQGNYHVGIASNKSPTSGTALYGILEVKTGSNGLIVQVFYTTTNNVYSRVKSSTSGVWNAWRRLDNV